MPSIASVSSLRKSRRRSVSLAVHGFSWGRGTNPQSPWQAEEELQLERERIAVIEAKESKLREELNAERRRREELEARFGSDEAELRQERELLRKVGRGAAVALTQRFSPSSKRINLPALFSMANSWSPSSDSRPARQRRARSPSRSPRCEHRGRHGIASLSNDVFTLKSCILSHAETQRQGPCTQPTGVAEEPGLGIDQQICLLVARGKVRVACNALRCV